MFDAVSIATVGTEDFATKLWLRITINITLNADIYTERQEYTGKSVWVVDVLCDTTGNFLYVIFVVIDLYIYIWKFRF